MTKLYYYSVVYRATRDGSVIEGSELPIKSMYFIDYSAAHSEAVQIMRCPVPSFVDNGLKKRYKNCTVFPSCYSVESMYVDDSTYNKLLNIHAIKGVVF